MPLFTLVLASDADRRSALAQRLRGLGHVVLHRRHPLVEPDVLVGEGGEDGIPALDPEDPELEVKLAALERAAGPRTLALSDREVDLRSRRVVRADGTDTLTSTELALLAWMATQPHEVVTREQLLVDVWGYAPTLRTRTVDTTLARLRAKIEADPKQPVHLQTLRGEGYRFVPAEGQPASPAAFAPTAGSSATPSAADGLLGREAELAELHDLLTAAPGVVTVLGGPGIGKTTLVQAWAPGAFVELASARSRADILAAVSSALDVRPEAIPAALNRPLALDNGEQVVEPLRELLGAWLAARPDARIAVTSRVRVGVAGERILELGPLPAPVATELLLTRARARRSGFARSERDQVHVQALVAILEGVPLALELAAARARVLSPRDLADRLRRDLGTLKDRSRPARQATVEGACQWSWDLLDDLQRAGLSALSVFRGGFDGGAAEAMGVDLDVLEALVDHSLVRLVGSPDGVLRFDVLEVLRAFAEARSDALEQCIEAHAAWLEAEADRWSDAARHTFEGVRNLGRERANTTAACRRLLATDPERAARVLLAHAPRWELHHAPPDHRELLDALWPVVDDPGLRGHLGYALALASYEGGELEHSGQVASEALLLAREAGASNVEARLLGMQAVLAHRAHDPDEALRLLDAVPDDVRDPLVRCDMLLTRAALARGRGDARAAEADLREAIAIAQREGCAPYAASLQGHLVVSLGVQKRYEEASELARRLLEVHRAQGNVNQLARLALNQANMLAMLGRPEAALALIDEVREGVHALGQPSLETALARQLAQALWLLGRLDEAVDAIEPACELSRAHGLTGEALYALSYRAEILLELGRLEAAGHGVEDAVSLAPLVPAHGSLAHTVAGDVAWARRRRAEAVDAWSAALAQDSERGPVDAVGLHGRLALAAVAEGADGRPDAERSVQRLEDRQALDRSHGARAWLALAVVQAADGQDPGTSLAKAADGAARSGRRSVVAAVARARERLAGGAPPDGHRWAEVARLDDALDRVDR